MTRYPQARYWMLTIPQEKFTPYLPSCCVYMKGQLELGNATQYLHWQIIVVFSKKVRRGRVKEVFGEVHCEATKGELANEYVWKEDTRVEGTQFELGSLPMNRNNEKDWEKIWDCAKRGAIEEIPADIRLRSYNNIKKIEKDYAAPSAIEREIKVFWGPTGTGKSRRAWDEAGPNAFPKDPCTKFWDGYQGQEHVVIDEFRGQIGISHVLRWFDRYPTIIENKGGATVFKARKVWITSNLHPGSWYPDLDAATYQALERRLNVEEMDVPYYEDIDQ